MSSIPICKLELQWKLGPNVAHSPLQIAVAHQPINFDQSVDISTTSAEVLHEFGGRNARSAEEAIADYHDEFDKMCSICL
jgi:hypothetical protein